MSTALVSSWCNQQELQWLYGNIVSWVVIDIIMIVIAHHISLPPSMASNILEQYVGVSDLGIRAY